jgi:hypothetical protein
MEKPALKKHAVRFIHNGKSRTYIVNALGTVDAICIALDLLECDVPDIESAIGLAVISKAYPEGAHLACEGDGPIIDTTRLHLAAVQQLVAA